MSGSPFPTATLSELASIKYGYTESASSEPVGPKFLRITDIQDGAVDWQSVPYCAIDAADAKKHRLEDGDIVFARTGATTGKSFLIKDPPEAVAASYLIRLRLTGKELLPEFLSLFFQTDVYWHSIAQGSSGSAQGGFNASKLGELKVPTPSLEEQKRIVAALKQIFVALDRARGLTEANLADAEDLERCVLRANLAPQVENWLTCKLEKVLSVLSGFAFKSKEYTDTGHFLIRIANVQDGQISLHRPQFVQLSSKTKKFELSEGDILTSLTGNIGRVAVIQEEHLPAALNQRVAKLVPKDALVSRDYLLQFLRSDWFGEPLRKKGRGAAQQNVSPNEIKNIDFFYPNTNQQTEIVKANRAIQEACDHLHNRYEQSMKDIADLRQSILQKAFAGELT